MYNFRIYDKFEFKKLSDKEINQHIRISVNCVIVFMSSNQTLNKNKDLFENMPVFKAIKVMAVPAIISQLIILIYNIADTFFIGRTNNPYMVAGVSLILPVFNISLPIASIMGVGGGALISSLLGQGKDEEAKKVSSFSIFVSLIFQLFLF